MVERHVKTRFGGIRKPVSIIGVEPNLELPALLAIAVRAAAGDRKQQVAPLAHMAARRMPASGAEAAAFDPCLQAISDGPRRWREGVERAAKARQGERRVGT